MPQGHEKLIVWKEADKLDVMVQHDILSRIPKFEVRMRGQIDGASDSVGSNLVEGYYSGSTKEYIRFCRYSRRSIGELQERVRRALRKGYLSDAVFIKFNDQAARTGYLFDRLILGLMKKLEQNTVNSKNRS